MGAPFSPATFLAQITARDVHVSLDGDTLEVDAPPGIVTEVVAERIRQAKPALIAYLRSVEARVDRMLSVLPPGRYDDRTRALVPEAEAGRLPDLLIGVGKRRMNANEFVLWATDQLQNKKPANVSPFHFVEWETKMRSILGRIADVYEGDTDEGQQYMNSYDPETEEANVNAEPIDINAI
jgi:hypothetical protein